VIKVKLTLLQPSLVPQAVPVLQESFIKYNNIYEDLCAGSDKYEILCDSA
jgi:hypothetical protein